MRKHLWSTVTLLVMAILAIGTSSTNSTKPDVQQPNPAQGGAGQSTPEEAWPFRFVESKTEGEDRRNVMELYVFSGDLDPSKLKSFCQERKSKSTAEGSCYVVIFDDASNARFPNTPFTAEYSGDEEALKHIRVIYIYNKQNGFSELRYHTRSLWGNIPTRETI